MYLLKKSHIVELLYQLKEYIYIYKVIKVLTNFRIVYELNKVFLLFGFVSGVSETNIEVGIAWTPYT